MRMAERSEVRFKTLKNIGAAVSEKTRPLWMFAFLSTGLLAATGILASSWAVSAGLGYAGDYAGDKLLVKPEQLGRKNAPTFASDLRNAIALPGTLIGKIRRW